MLSCCLQQTLNLSSECCREPMFFQSFIVNLTVPGENRIVLNANKQ